MLYLGGGASIGAAVVTDGRLFRGRGLTGAIELSVVDEEVAGLVERSTVSATSTCPCEPARSGMA